MVYLFLAEGFEEVEALTVVDLLRRAKCDITSVSVTGSKAVCGGHGITVMADALLEELSFNNAKMLGCDIPASCGSALQLPGFPQQHGCQH